MSEGPWSIAKEQAAGTGGDAPRTLELLLVYSQHEPRVRANVTQHLAALERYGRGWRVHSLNAFFGVPRYLTRVRFDAVVFHYTFLAWKWNLSEFAWFLGRTAGLKQVSGYKIAFAQDEYVHSEAICSFLRDFGVRSLFGQCEGEDVQRVYPAESGLEHYVHALTGYVDEAERPRIEALALPVDRRTIDVGYRARQVPYWLGRAAQLKWQLAERVAPRAIAAGLRTDISTRIEDTLYEDDWFRFLGRCRVTLGCESGATLHDPRGAVRQAVETYLARNPRASFDEAEAACFAGMDGSLSLLTVSPRHFECAILRTCQVLVEGRYAGLLEPERHYISLRRDFGNLDDVLHRLKDVDACARIAEEAYRRVVGSGLFTYEGFARACLEHLSREIQRDRRPGAQRLPAWAVTRLKVRHRVAAALLALVPPYRRCRHAAKRVLRAIVPRRS